MIVMTSSRVAESQKLSRDSYLLCRQASTVVDSSRSFLACKRKSVRAFWSRYKWK